MRAFRTAELAPYGIRGCGWVFETYRSGRIIADDEVAVTYSPEDLSCLTVPLVIVRRWLECLEMRGLVDPPTSRRLLAKARRLFYAGPDPYQSDAQVGEGSDCGRGPAPARGFRWGHFGRQGTGRGAGSHAGRQRICEAKESTDDHS